MERLVDIISMLERFSKNFHNYRIIEKNQTIDLVKTFFSKKNSYQKFNDFNYDKLLDVKELNAFIETLKEKNS